LRRTITILALLALATLLTGAILQRVSELGDAASAQGAERAPAPVEVAPIERGPITLRRTFSGTLEAAAQFVVAPKVAGRVRRVDVDLGDTVERGQVVVLIDDEEFVEAVNQAEADLAVARASHSEALSALEIIERALGRVESLRVGGVTSESQLDVAKADELSRRAHVEVTEANVKRAEAMLEAARIRRGYARVIADWSGGDDQRVVAERHVDEGGTVSANAPLLTIVELDPIVGVVHVPERDYALLAPGQPASLTTDSHPGRAFAGHVARIAPVFRSSTRQARVELRVDNLDEALKPGMFTRATLEFARVEDAIIVPFDALTERDSQMGVFVLDDAGERVTWRTVEVGIREGARAQVSGDGLTGRVVTLGQELCDDGSRVAPANGTGLAAPLRAPEGEALPGAARGSR
jgi:RND family efflux transporter MFP subunit